MDSAVFTSVVVGGVLAPVHHKMAQQEGCDTEPTGEALSRASSL